MLPLVIHPAGTEPYALPTATLTGFSSSPRIFLCVCVWGGRGCCRKEEAEPLPLSVTLSPVSHHFSLPWSLSPSCSDCSQVPSLDLELETEASDHQGAAEPKAWEKPAFPRRWTPVGRGQPGRTEAG